MGQNTSIEWTDATWNPLRGCSRKSAGCHNCYAAAIAYRFSGRGKPFEGYVKLVNGVPAFTGKVTTLPKRLLEPLSWIDGRRVFVNSMSDLFHPRVPFEFIADVFAVMSCTTRHTYQVLTKHPERAIEWLNWLRDEIHTDTALHLATQWYGAAGRWPVQVDATEVYPKWEPWRDGKRGGYDNCGPSWPLKNVCIGASIENREVADERFTALAAIGERGWNTMVSMEPLLEAVEIPERYLRLREKAWVVIGGESGPDAREFHIEWAERLIEQCKAAQVPVFLKQLGRRPFWTGTHVRTVDGGLMLLAKPLTAPYALKDKKGGDWSEWPERLRVREFPR